MPSPSDEPLARCDLNLYAADKAWLQRRFGQGWSEQVRNWVRAKIKESNND